MDTPGTPDHRAGPQAPTEGDENTKETVNKAVPKWLDPTLETNTPKAPDPAPEHEHNYKPNQHESTLDTDQDTYRLTDHVYLSMKICENKASDADPYAPEFCNHPELKFLSELHRATLESQHLLKPISDKHAATGQYLKNLNKRFGLLQQFIMASSTWANLSPNCQVTLSEEGFHFTPAVGDTFELNQRIHVQMVLFPNLAHLCVFGCVRQVETIDHRAHINLDFEQLQPSEQQILAKHILQKQIEQRRKRQAPPE